jgi:hypothetical protein
MRRSLAGGAEPSISKRLSSERRILEDDHGRALRLAQEGGHKALQKTNEAARRFEDKQRPRAARLAAARMKIARRAKQIELGQCKPIFRAWASLVTKAKEEQRKKIAGTISKRIHVGTLSESEWVAIVFALWRKNAKISRQERQRENIESARVAKLRQREVHENYEMWREDRDKYIPRAKPTNCCQRCSKNDQKLYAVREQLRPIRQLALAQPLESRDKRFGCAACRRRKGEKEDNIAPKSTVDISTEPHTTLRCVDPPMRFSHPGSLLFLDASW